MDNSSKTWRISLCLGVIIFDSIWAFSALNSDPAVNQASTVSMLNAVVWIYLHLPAALLAGVLFGQQVVSPALALPTGQVALMGSLGVLQMALIAYLLGRALDRRKVS